MRPAQNKSQIWPLAAPLLVFTCLMGCYGQADFLSTTHFLCGKMAQILRNMLTMQQNFKENGFTISLIVLEIIHDILAFVITYFGHVRNYVGQVNIIKYLPSMVS